MGQVFEKVEDKLIDPIPDRDANRLRIYKKESGEVAIHFRNFKLVLLDPQDIAEWRHGFTVALEELRKHDYFKNDL